MSVTEKASEVFGQLRATAKSTSQDLSGILQTLAEEHGKVDAMMKRVKSAGNDAQVRNEFFPTIRKELLAHSDAEEEKFYDVIRKEASLKDKVEHSEKEHRDIEKALDKVGNCNPDTDAWGAAFDELMETVDHHVDEEEGEVFPAAAKHFSREQLENMDDDFKAAKKQAMGKSA